MREAVIVDCARSAFGKRKGALAGWHPDRSARSRAVDARRAQRHRSRPASTMSSAAASRSPVSRAATSPATRGSRPACPWSVPATSVDRQCGSSQQAAHFVAQGVIAGAYDIAIACGVESMTRAPMSSNARGGIGPFSRRRSSPTPTTRSASSSGSRRCWPTSGESPARRWTRSRSSRTDARGREHRQRVLRGRDRAGADQGRETVSSTGETLDDRRRHPPRRDARDARGAAAGVGVGRPARARHHRRQLVADDRRRGGDARSPTPIRRTTRPARSGLASRTSRSPPRTRCSCSRRRCPSRTS